MTALTEPSIVVDKVVPSQLVRERAFEIFQLAAISLGRRKLVACRAGASGCVGVECTMDLGDYQIA